MYFRTKVFIIFFFILSFVSGFRKIYGITYFFDDFSQENSEDWIFDAGNSNQKNWNVVDGKLVGEVVSNKYSFLLAKDFGNLSDYLIRFDSFNEGGVDQEIVFRVVEDRSKYYMLNLRFKDPYWPQDGGEIVLWKRNPIGWYKNLATFNDLNQINLTQNQVHKIKIEVNGPSIRAYFDNVLVINIVDNDNPILTGSFGFYNWGGNYNQRPTRNWFDNLIVGDFNYDEPVPVAKPKIIIVPGFGASWNSEAIVYNTEVGNDRWEMTPFVKNYDGLIDAFKQNGLKEDEDFYIWNYDWRQPVASISAKLNDFINLKIGSSDKVDLVGHSLGGLVSRIWAEDNKNDFRMNKIITLGSPHLGTVESYEAWNGGQISDLSKFSSIAFKILLKLQGLTTKTDMEAVRKYTPSVKDLLPTFNFVSKNGVKLTNDKLETKNIFLENKNNEGIGSSIDLKLFVGNGYKTMNSVELKDNNIFDKILGIWPDGKINKFLYTNNGDNMVLTKSANYGRSDFVEIDSKHGDIIDEAIDQIMMEIGLSQVDIISESQDLSDSLVVFVGSPVNYSVKCDDDSPVLENNGFVIIKNKNYTSCDINLIGTGNGLVHVVVGNTDDNNWFYWEKNIVNGEINNIKVDPDNGQVISDNDNILFLKSIIQADINSLLLLNKNNKDLKEALKFLDKNQPRLLIKSIFDFRKRSNERVVSEKIIDNVTIWLSLVDKCFNNKAIGVSKIVNNYQNLIDRLVNLKYKKVFKINENAAISYQKMDEILKINKTKMEKKDYFGVCANNFTALNYGSEVLFKSYGDESKKWLLEDSNL